MCVTKPLYRTVTATLGTEIYRERSDKVMAAETKGKILLVEDDADTRFALAMLFELEGFEVSCAGDGQEAYLKARSTQPDLIVTDINMPKVSGLDLIRLIREDGKLGGIPIIAMSAVEKQYLNRAKELGASAVCQKPIEFDQFLSLIVKIISTRHMRRNGHALAERRKPVNREKEQFKH
jgi:CheY-like chemotaxis protein